ADMLKEVPTAIKWISNRDSSLQKVFKPINNFFGQVYMGASPGFAARNAINNTFTMMVDQGVKSVVSTEGKLLTGFEAIATDIERWAGFVPKAAAMEIGSLAEDVTGSAAKSGWLRDLLPKNLASNNEKFTGALIVNKSGSSAFKQILPHALSPLKNALIESGIDNKAIDLIMQLGVDEFGDIGRVTERLREFSELGSISAGRDVTKIPYSLRKYLTETNQLETLTDIMLDPKLEGIDDYLAAVDKFAETHIKSADNVFRDPMGAINQDSFDAV
ncbi:MAG: hypothetical protein GY755_24110, partial [Chloroflexi bacterium]|nr:hypothetical protein [Chloroflexota bacterium]